MSNLIYRTEAVHLATQVAAATTTKNTAALDMQNYDGVVFLGRVKTAMATTKSVNIAQASATGGTFVDISNAVVRACTNWRIDVNRPAKRYLRVETHRSSVALGDIWAIQYSARQLSSSTQTFAFAHGATSTA